MRHEHVAKGSDKEINLFDAVISFKNLLHIWVFFFFFLFLTHWLNWWRGVQLAGTSGCLCTVDSVCKPCVNICYQNLTRPFVTH